MLTQAQLQQAVATIGTLDRREVISQMRAADLPFPVDFTPEWIDGRSIDELRHVFAAICLQCDVMPAPSMAIRLSPARELRRAA